MPPVPVVFKWFYMLSLGALESSERRALRQSGQDVALDAWFPQQQVLGLVHQGAP